MALLFNCDVMYSIEFYYVLDCWCFSIYVVCIDQDGRTALILAANKGHHECLSLLLARGAEVDKSVGVSIVIGCPWSIWHRLSSMYVNHRWTLVSIIGWAHSSNNHRPKRISRLPFDSPDPWCRSQ